MDFIQLAQSVDPTKIGQDLGKAQDVQQLLGIVVSVLLAALLALVFFYLKERSGWNKEKVELVKAGDGEKLDLISRWNEAKIKWENERLRHAEQLSAVQDKSSTEKEALYREMMELALRLEKVLGRLANERD